MGPCVEQNIEMSSVGGLGQHVLHVLAVLAHDVAVIATCLGEPLLVLREVDLVGVDIAVKRVERAEGVGREQHAVGRVGRSS